MPSGVSLPPIPAPNEVDARFEQVLKKMDLPLDKARVLRQYDQKKKWELVCDQDKMTEKDPPAAYLAKLQAFMDKKVLKKKRKELGEETSTTVLKHLEISLRTNSIDWVKEFLAAEGLKTLVDYLETVQEAGGLTDSVWDGDDSATPASTSAAPAPAAHSRLAVRSKSSSFPAKLLNPEDDIHVGIQCLRAVMNNKAGFNGVFASERAIYAITRSLLHKSLRTKAQVLELLAAVCLVKGGHDLVMDAFDRFQRLHGELRRFASLFRFFAAPDDFHVDFMVTAMQFINIVVHSVDDMNYRIFLQQEWKRLGLEEVLERLGKQESAELQTQIQAYEENLYDVGALVAESEERTAALAERDAAALQLSRANERLQEQEADYLMQMGQLDRRMQVLLAERDRLAQLHQSNETEVHTLKRLVSEKDRELRSKSSTLEAQIAELERAKAQLSADKRPANPLAHPPAPGPPSAKSAHSPPVPPPRSEHTELSGQSPPPPPPSANPPPPPPPPPSSVPPPPPPPPPPGPPPPPSLKGLNGPPAFDVKTIKRRIQTRYKLPQLNWTPLKPNQLKNTVFDKLDDDKVMEAIDFNQLEELFKLGMKPGSSEEKAGADRTDTAPAKKATENTLLDHKRLRNLAITRRKLGKEPVELMAAVHRFDLESLDLESVELLLRIIPTSEEIQAYKTFETAGKSLDSLSEEDRFFGQLCKIERLSTKLTIMAFMGNFGETAELIQPQLRILMAASSKARDARRFHKVLELVLAYGNYMNSAKRGGAYGFKLQSLETLGFLKSPADKGITLLHLVAGTVEEKFPELAGFGEELVLAEKGSTVGLESVLADLHELERGWAAASKEAGSRDDVPPLLARFLADAKARMDALSEQAKLAQESYRSCLEFYGESGKSLDSAAFFSILHNFARRFAQAQADNVERRKAQQRAAAEEERRRRVKEARGLGGGSGAGGDGGTLAERQAAVLGEMALVVGGGGGGGDRRKPPDRARRATQKIEQNELNEIGALDQILAYIRETPPQQQANGRAQGPPVPEKRHRPPKPSLHDSRDRPTHAS